MPDHPYSSDGRTAASRADRVPGPDTLTLLSSWSPMADKFGGWNSTAQRTYEEIVQRWFKFLGDRVAKDVALAEQLAACKNANDVYLVYSQFWQQAAKDYTTEFTAITRAFWEMMGSLEPGGSRKFSSRYQ
jgi:hypothetical protein